jgi:hypothetical protein
VKKIAQPVVVKIYTNISRGKKLQNFGLKILKKTAQSKQSPNRRKFAQSGHPAGKLHPFSRKNTPANNSKTQPSSRILQSTSLDHYYVAAGADNYFLRQHQGDPIGRFSIFSPIRRLKNAEEAHTYFWGQFFRG